MRLTIANNYYSSTMAPIKGFSLLEVMIALVVFTIGMLGMVALTATATKIGNAAYLNTQALILAQDMANRMSSNPFGLFEGGGDGNYFGDAPSNVVSSCESLCSGVEAAQVDMEQWGRRIATVLPNGIGNIQCRQRLGTGVIGSGYIPIADGPCWIRITWDEPSTLNPAGFETRILDYGFQP